MKIFLKVFLFLLVTSFAAKADSWSTDMFGNTSGFIGDDYLSSSTDMFGNTSGFVGDEYFSCSTDMFGNTTCY